MGNIVINWKSYSWSSVSINWWTVIIDWVSQDIDEKKIDIVA